MKRMNDIPCPACGVIDWYRVFDSFDLGRSLLTHVPVAYFACRSCGIGSKFPQPTEDELKDYYEKSWQFSVDRPAECYDRAARWILDSMSLAEHEAGLGTMRIGLEVGCKDYPTLRALRKLDMPLFKMEAWDPQLAGDGHCWLGSGEVERGESNVVVASHVLEHAINPCAFMVDLQRLTKHRGYVYVEVPSLTLGERDPGSCDDMNRNHLWHFSQASLFDMARRSNMTVVACVEDNEPRGWPVTRLLLRNCSPDKETMRKLSMMKIRRDTIYHKACGLIEMESPSDTGLFGASESCMRMMLETKGMLFKFPLFDTFKAGSEFLGRDVLSPDKMAGMGIKQVYLTPRMWNTRKEIEEFLKDKYEWLIVKNPYSFMSK